MTADQISERKKKKNLIFEHVKQRRFAGIIKAQE